MNTNFNENNIKVVKRLYESLLKGYSISSKQVVDTYNEIFDGVKQRQPYTNCGSCMRKLIAQMNVELTKYFDEQIKTLDNVFECADEEPKEEPTLIEPIKRKGRPKKN